MKKKILLTSALCLALNCGFGSAASYAAGNVTVQTEQTVVDTQANGQVDIESQAVPSEEVNTVEESSLARKMTKEEKAHNAQVNDSWGGAITIIAMCVVLAALIVLSLLFLGFGKISSSIMSSKKRQSHGVSKDDAEDFHEDLDSGEVIAAIAAAIAEHFDTRGHDMERTILTLRRMKRAYSPWNSKIYNMREVPVLKRNAAKTRR